jgi:S-adenosylmethionine:tRNA ribosyltransferase-isomerase
VELYKDTGGKVEVFFLANEIKDKNKFPVVVDRKIEVGKYLYIKESEKLIQVFKIFSQEENKFYLQAVLENGKENLSFDLEQFLDKYGNTPTPKYIKIEEKNNEEIREKYQTIFAKDGMSVAAPTASLHFTEKVFEDLKNKKCEIEKIRLDVGFGTFITPTDENMKKGKIHTEPVFIKNEIIKNILNAKNENRKIVAVGTTVVRSLESYSGEEVFDTDIFIKPPHNFKMIDILQTNFHLPNTSLMMLVQAFLKYKGSKLNLVDIYNIAIENKFEFYSLGDAMLIL